MISYIKGDLFSHTARKIPVLAHACNPHGSWGGGIAAQFRKRYPNAYEKYAHHCKTNKSGLLGSTLLIPPSSERENVYIACLFTSDFSTDPPQIVSYTQSSMESLSEQLASLDNIERDENNRPVVCMPTINSGIFNVPWEDTEKALRHVTSLSINVYTL